MTNDKLNSLSHLTVYEKELFLEQELKENFLL